MDRSSFASLYISWVELGFRVIDKWILFAYSTGARYRRARFGVAGDILYLTQLVDTDALQQMHWNINLWTDKEVLVWRDSYLATCNAVSVAGAIVASIGLTALQLHDMYTVHWSARALCVASMIMGVLSVTMATYQQHALAMLNNPTSIRLWLSRGRPTAYELKFLFEDPVMPKNIYSKCDTSMGIASATKCNGVTRQSIQPVGGNRTILLLIVGFGLYLLFQWVEDMRGQPIPNRNVFIVFIVCVGTFVLYYSYIVSNIFNNQTKKAKEFDLLELGGPHKPAALEELEKDLEEVQKRMESLEDQRRGIESQIRGIVRTSRETGRSSGDAPETG